MNNAKEKKSKNIVNTWIKFVFCSMLGLFFFFVKVEIGGNSRIPADHLIALCKAGLNGWYSYIILILTAISIIRRFITKKEEKNLTDLFFFVQSALGLILCTLVVFRWLPEEIMDIAQSAINATGNILCAIFLTSLFIPFLTEYGLVDFVGVICEPFMRKIFLTPGSSAVIGVSAFLGNYSMGHVISKQMYDEGHFTEKESVIVSVGFSTCSIGLMINLINYMDMMDYWTLYVVSVLLVTFLTTIIMARIWPVRRKKEEYIGGIQQIVVLEKSDKLMSRAAAAGLEKAAAAPPLLYSVKNILKRVFPIICEITGTSIFIIPLGMFLVEYTNVFQVIGGIFYPLLRVLGVESAGALIGAEALGISILEPVLAGVISNGAVLSVITKWIIAIVPYSAIVFFAGFVPSLWKSGINCKVYEMILIWLERVIIGILMSAALAYLFMAIGLLG